MSESTSCGINGCDRKVRAWGMCDMHWQRCRSLGHPGITMPRTPEQRFDATIEKRDDGCWHWTGYLNNWGYGYIRVNGQKMRAHRFSYERFKAPIPDGMVIDHLCSNRACVNPDHLEAVTPRENTRRGGGPSGDNARKTHCPQGHAYAEHARITAGGFRVCIPCDREKHRRYRARRRERQA